MHPKRKQRMIYISLMFLGLALASTLILYALRNSISFYYTPTQVAQGKSGHRLAFYLGGIVKPGTIKSSLRKNVVNFMVTDHKTRLLVHYAGALPNLFGPNQGVVVFGHLNKRHIFIATQLLAKHGANYMPPGLKRSAA